MPIPTVSLLIFPLILLLGSTPRLSGHDDASSAAPGPTPPIVSGLHASQLPPELQGRILIEETGCIACHAADESLIKDSKVAPRLNEIGQRANPYYLERFILSPRNVKPGTTMPDVLGHLDDETRKQTAQALTHFLVSLSKSDFRPQVPDLVAAEFGQELFHSVGCVACHSPRDAEGRELLTDRSTPLGNLTGKYNAESLTQFLADPHRVRPSGRMPNLNLDRRDYARIAHYLLRDTQVPGHLRYTLMQGRVWEGLDVNVEKVRSGHVKNFDLQEIENLPQNAALIYEGFFRSETAGTARFFANWNGGQLWINGQSVMELPASDRRGTKKSEGQTELVAGANAIRLVYFHTGQEPKLQFEVEAPGQPRQPPRPEQLSVSDQPIEPYQPYQVDASLVTKGARAFVEQGCVQCHQDVQQYLPEKLQYASPAPLAKLNLERGCLDRTEKTQAPGYDFSPEQLGLIRQALTSTLDTALPTAQVIDKSLITFNCTACHDRQGLAGVDPERNPFFVGNKTELGNEGRIPPPLTDVGAKLQSDWIAEVMLRGQRQRDYLATRMPQFGKANVGHLVELFEQVDSVPPVTFKEIKDRDLVKDAGKLLVGTQGFSCIACHDFNGQKAAGPGAMDIIHSTSRLKKDWFYWFMLKPDRFRKGTIMPASWPGGHVFMEDVLDGDAKQQIESIWIYLEDGTRASNPVGLSRKSPELRVTDQTLICRGRGTAGYRGMGIGYPERISLAFDTQEMNLRLLWKGEFATVDDGRFFARGRDRIEFPPGIPFHRLESLDDNWPYKRKTDYLFPQELGYRFDGYTLGDLKRPTLRYRYGDIRVSDYFEDRLDEDNKPYFTRTLTLTADSDQPEFYFRAAAGEEIQQLGDDRFQIGSLKIHVQGAAGHVIREGNPRELLFRIRVPQGKTVLKLDYQW